MHSHGRALTSPMMRHLDELENYRIREDEFTWSTLVGWQFGDAHRHLDAAGCTAPSEVLDLTDRASSKPLPAWLWSHGTRGSAPVRRAALVHLRHRPGPGELVAGALRAVSTQAVVSPAPIICFSPSATEIGTRRGLADSCTGTWMLSTPLS